MVRTRLDVWAPRLQPVIALDSDEENIATAGDFLTEVFAEKWVMCETTHNISQNLRRTNAVIKCEIEDNLYEPRVAVIEIDNKWLNFKAGDWETYNHTYRVPGGTNYLTANSGVIALRKNMGPFDYFFRQFQYVRLVDEETDEILFTGQVKTFTSGFDDQRGQTVNVVCVDTLMGLKGTMTPGLFGELVRTVTFADDVKRSDMIKFFLEQTYRPFSQSNNSIALTPALDQPEMLAGEFDIQTDDGGLTSNTQKRFQDSVYEIPKGPILTVANAKDQTVLDEISIIAVSEPHADSANGTGSYEFGFDFFVDTGADIDNVSGSASPKSQFFNYHKRGTRLSVIGGSSGRPKDWGLSVILPVSDTTDNTAVEYSRPRNVFDKANSAGSTKGAIKRMAMGSKFTATEAPNFTHIHLKYGGGVVKSEDDEEVVLPPTRVGEKRFEIFYANQFTGQLYWQNRRFTENRAHPTTGSTNPKAGEWLKVLRVNGADYNTDANGKLTGSIISGSSQYVARMQYWSGDTINNADYDYVLLSDTSKDQYLEGSNQVGKIPEQNYTGDAYVRFVGMESGKEFRVDLDATIANKGRPAKIFGHNRVHSIAKTNFAKLDDIRQEMGSTLHGSIDTTINGTFLISGLPHYKVDAEVTTIANLGSNAVNGQRITVQNNTNVLNVCSTGFREGMLIAKVDATWGKVLTTTQSVGGVPVTIPLTGYCYNINSNSQMDVKINAQDAGSGNKFAVGEKVQLFIPLRCGDTILVNNVLSKIYGDQIITRMVYTEGERAGANTALTTHGQNERRPDAGGKMKANPEAQPLLKATGNVTPIPPMKILGAVSNNEMIQNQQAVFANNASVEATGDEATAYDFEWVFPTGVAHRLEWQKTGSTTATMYFPGDGYFEVNDSTGTTTSGTSQASPIGLGTSGMTVNTPYIVYLDIAQNITEGVKYDIQTKTIPAYSKLDKTNLRRIALVYTGTTKVHIDTLFVTMAEGAPLKKEGPIVIANASLSSALLNEAARPWTSNLDVEGTAFNAIKWDNGTDNTAATLTFANNETVTLTAGTATSLGQGTHYLYVDGTSAGLAGQTILPVTNTNNTVAVGDKKILLALVVVGVAADGDSPLIVPFNSKKMTVNAVAIAADAIVANHIQANTIDAGKFTTTVRDFHNSRSKTHVGDNAPTSPTPVNGDIWFKTSDNPVTIWAYDTSLNPDAWVKRNDNAPEGGGATVFKTANVSSPPTSNAENDLWYVTDTDTVYVAVTHPANSIETSTEWVKQDVVTAINSASTLIDGGLINTAKIILTANGANILETGEGTSPSAARIELSNTAIAGYSSSGESNKEFEIRADNGKGSFGGGAGILSADGLDITQTSGDNTANPKIQFTSSTGSTQILKYNVAAGTIPASTMYMGRSDMPAGWALLTSGQKLGDGATDPSGFIYAGTRTVYTTLGRDTTGGAFAGLLLRGSDAFETFHGTPTNTYGWLFSKSDGKLYFKSRSTANGTQTYDLTASTGGPFQLSSGSSSSPAYSFSANTDVGMYYNGSGWALVHDSQVMANTVYQSYRVHAGTNQSSSSNQLQMGNIRFPGPTGGGDLLFSERSGAPTGSGYKPPAGQMYLYCNAITRSNGEETNNLFVENDLGHVGMLLNSSTDIDCNEQRITNVYKGTDSEVSIGKGYTYATDDNNDTGLYWNDNYVDTINMSAGGHRCMSWHEGLISGTKYSFIGIDMDNYGGGYSLKVLRAAWKNDQSGYWSYSSDVRIKTNINTIVNGMDVISQLRPIAYNLTDEYLEATGHSDKHHFGYLAHEFETVFPDHTETEDTGLIYIDGKWEVNNGSLPSELNDVKNLKSINEAPIMPHIVAAIQELKAEIETLKTQVAQLGG